MSFNENDKSYLARFLSESLGGANITAEIQNVFVQLLEGDPVTRAYILGQVKLYMAGKKMAFEAQKAGLPMETTIRDQGLATEISNIGALAEKLEQLITEAQGG